MKRLFLFAASVWMSFSVAQAQNNDPKAGEILEAMSSKYKSVKGFKATFSYSMESPGSGIKENATGEIVVKDSKFYLKLGGQEVINNGSTVWTYLKDANEVTITDYEPDDDDITPSNIYNVYKKGYKYTLVPKESNKVDDVIDLTPDNKNSQVNKIRIIVNKKDKSIKSFKTFERNGNKYNYTITNFTPTAVDDKTFVFDKTKYKGVEVEDLRN
ncbi:outer membrane lipoprotein carrier protein LolA [Cytophagaceae bacterium DM2B3-1]|uniref:Outer membrane lipoprotein carrier protein LolA n=1 Tax=Xanthocytophaga flava TaxID=3048013 RepID=A0AAE3QWV5_9BACT|nr:outer membrane lipoprotein carrier protein LolA [Xanthocytophaga flavus]MDJ1471951.1 outer membrane lipoprotein carrier protein LolA [Xanthocytophaga flavus]MDJ1484661.1 outer membrane lipoprotein carrier protein LolA [Xanthocytophaga flavus]MDJ1496888.1 outer membrane lipoprotein carrier protein LolA [Xanthocytophaga flavus]